MSSTLSSHESLSFSVYSTTRETKSLMTVLILLESIVSSSRNFGVPVTVKMSVLLDKNKELFGC